MERCKRSFVREGGSLFLGMQRLGILSLLLLFLAGSASAQVSTASINGVIRDPTGAVVPGASIVLTNVDTSVERTSTANSAGAYGFVSIPPGNYTLESTAKGFSSQKLAPFVLAVGQAATFDFALTVGTETQVVNVEAAAAQLDVTNANLGTVIATKQVNDLPLNGRNFTALLALTPGVVAISTAQNGTNIAGGGFGSAIALGSDYTFPAINGQSNRSDYFLADGLPNYTAINSTYAVAPIIDAIQEFKVVSHTDDAEFGSVIGGVVNVVTKSGTNELHGSAWDYLRNTAFDARSYFLPTSQSKPFFHQNQFGGAVGGPVIIPKLYNGRNKTFFFGAYQGWRYSRAQDNNILVPTAAELAGDEADNGQNPIYDPFSTVATPTGYTRTAFPNNQIPADRIDQRMVTWAKFIYPTAGPFFNPTGSGSFSANAVDTTPQVQKFDEFSVRLDQTLGSKDSAWFRYSFSNSTLTQSGGLPGLPSSLIINGRNFGGSFVHVFGPTRIAQFQGSHSEVLDNGTTFFKASTADLISAVGWDPSFVGNFSSGRDYVPQLSIQGISGGGESINLTPLATDNNAYQGSITQILGNHTAKFGLGWVSTGFKSTINYTQTAFNSQQTSAPQLSGLATGNGIASFLLNVPQSGARRNVTELERPGGVLSAYLQDTWKVTPRLNLNYGLRYDYTFMPAYGTNATIGKNGGIETGDWDWDNGTYIVQKLPPPCSVRGFAPCIPGDGTLPAHVVVSPNDKISHNVHTNFGPRVGFAYKATDRTAVHGAFGIVYDNWAAVTQLVQNAEGSWPDVGQLGTPPTTNLPSTASPTPTVNAQNPFGGTPGGGLFPPATPYNDNDWFFDPNYKNAYSEQWNFGVQQQLSNSLSLRMDYVGSGSHRTNVGGYYNTALTPGPGDPQTRAPYPYAAPTLYDHGIGSSSYNALQVSLDKRFTQGLSFQVAYTWSESFTADDGWFNSEGITVQDAYNPKASRGYAGTNVPHVLAINTIYDVPVGRGRRFSTGNRFGDYILGNWQINNIFNARNGQNQTVVDTQDIANIGNTNTYERANRIGNPFSGFHRSASEWFNTAAYAIPAQYTFGNSYRNEIQGQRLINFDTSVIRSFPLWRETSFQFRAEAFNLFNHPVFGLAEYNSTDLNSPSTFGSVDGTLANTPRELQFSGKIVF
jgi:outer membrane receptor protein involved in Fe transport